MHGANALKVPATTPFLLCFLYFRWNRKQHTQTVIREAHGSAQCAKQRIRWLELGAASREPKSGDRLKKSQLDLKPGARVGQKGSGQNHWEAELSFSEGGQCVAWSENESGVSESCCFFLLWFLKQGLTI